jgi:hypothetical protein
VAQLSRTPAVCRRAEPHERWPEQTRFERYLRIAEGKEDVEEEAPIEIEI